MCLKCRGSTSILYLPAFNPWQPHRHCHTRPWYSQLSPFYFFFRIRHPLNIRHISTKDWGKRSPVCPRCLLGRQCQFNQTLAHSCECTDRAASTTRVQLLSVHMKENTPCYLGWVCPRKSTVQSLAFTYIYIYLIIEQSNAFKNYTWLEFDQVPGDWPSQSPLIRPYNYDYELFRWLKISLVADQQYPLRVCIVYSILRILTTLTNWGVPYIPHNA